MKHHTKLIVITILTIYIAGEASAYRPVHHTTPRPVHRPTPRPVHRSVPRPVHHPTAFIRSSCKVTRYPDVCEQYLAAYASSVRRSPRHLAIVALSVSANHARSVSGYVDRLMPGSKSSRSREAGAVRDCIETMHDSVDRLRRSVQEMVHMGRARSNRFNWHLNNVQTWVSAALTDESTCLDSVAQNAGPAVRSAVRKKVVEVAQVTSNALALVNQLEPKY